MKGKSNQIASYLISMWESSDSNIQTLFFKCTNWQLEETLDPHSCPYHYYCNSFYPGNYTPVIDLIVLIFILLCFCTAITFTVMELGGRQSMARRYLLPSGPLSLPILVLIMAKGYRINTLFPMTKVGPAILQLIRISALAFDTSATSDASYVFLESSTISGVLHTALYLDSIVLPYYTGMDALSGARLSGECRSCVCRDRALTVGGGLVVFRGWSVTTAMVAGTLFLRIVGRVWKGNKHIHMTRGALEALSWMMIGVESVYLVTVVPDSRAWAARATYAGVFVLMCLHATRKVCAWFTSLYATQHTSPTRMGKGASSL